MSDPTDVQGLLRERLQECRVDRRALEVWLGRLGPLNWITLVMPALLSVIAGATILGEPAFLGPDLSKVVAGGAALLSALLTAVHKALECDSYQSECKRLKKAYAKLEVLYGRLSIADQTQLRAQIEQLDQRLAQLRGSADVKAPDWCVRRARSDQAALIGESSQAVGV